MSPWQPPDFGPGVPRAPGAIGPALGLMATAGLRGALGATRVQPRVQGILMRASPLRQVRQLVSLELHSLVFVMRAHLQFVQLGAHFLEHFQ